MEKKKEVPFLSTRLKDLREANNCTMDELVKRLADLDDDFKNYNKSSISRLESGDTSEKTRLRFAKFYCKAFGMTDAQTEQFLRGQKIAIPDTSALLKNANLVNELAVEYSKIIIPMIVTDELANIKNNPGAYSMGLSNQARKAENSIKASEKAIAWSYTGDKHEVNEDRKIIYIAQEVSDQFHCNVDIITEDVDYFVYLKGHDSIKALHLREYLATRQGLVNMTRIMHIDETYADNYDDLEVPLREEVNAFLPDGRTLLISCVRRYDKPLNQRKAKIKWLIEHGADVNKRESGNNFLPALSYAIQMKDQYEMFEFLLDECGADPNAGSRNPQGIAKVRQKNEGNMPLMIAAWWGKEKYVRKLCEHEKISLNQQDENGFTALIKACTNGNSKCRDILINAGADTRIIDINGKNYQDHWDEYLDLGPLRTRFQKNGKNDNARKGKNG